MIFFHQHVWRWCKETVYVEQQNQVCHLKMFKSCKVSSMLGHPFLRLLCHFLVLFSYFSNNNKTVIPTMKKGFADFFEEPPTNEDSNWIIHEEISYDRGFRGKCMTKLSNICADLKMSYLIILWGHPIMKPYVWLIKG